MIEFFLREQLTASSLLLYLQKSSLIYIWHGSKYASDLLNSICYYNADDNAAFPSSEIQVKY